MYPLHPTPQISGIQFGWHRKVAIARLFLFIFGILEASGGRFIYITLEK
jgi:hypothetical protein